MEDSFIAANLWLVLIYLVCLMKFETCSRAKSVYCNRRQGS